MTNALIALLFQIAAILLQAVSQPVTSEFSPAGMQILNPQNPLKI